MIYNEIQKLLIIILFFNISIVNYVHEILSYLYIYKKKKQYNIWMDWYYLKLGNELIKRNWISDVYLKNVWLSSIFWANPPLPNMYEIKINKPYIMIKYKHNIL